MKSPPEESVRLGTLARLHLWLPVFTHLVTTSEIDKDNKFRCTILYKNGVVFLDG